MSGIYDKLTVSGFYKVVNMNNRSSWVDQAPPTYRVASGVVVLWVGKWIDQL